MLRFALITCIITFYSLNIFAQEQQYTSISLEEAAQLLYKNNNTLKSSEKNLEIAKGQKQQLNSAWYPFISATGGYTYLSNNIEAKASIAEITEPLKDPISNILPDIKQILPSLVQKFPEIAQLLPKLNSMLSNIGSINLSFPLLEQNLSQIDLTLLWPVFTGGKRIYSGKIGKEIEGAAKNLNNKTIQTQYALMIQAYYSLKLCQEVIKVNNESVNCMTQLYNNAKSLLNNGFINKAELLVAQVAMEEAIRELENSKEAEKVAQNALSTIIGCIGNTHPSSNFFIIANIPSQDYYNQLVIENNSQLKALDNQIGIISQQNKIAKSNYLPNIALFAKQNIYSYNVPKNLSPRTVIGAAAQWTLFDGLNREKSIKVSNLEYNKLLESRTQIEKDLILAAHKLRSNMIEALNNLKVLTSTINLSTELLRVREKSFAEGMANSTDVVTAQTMLAKAKIASHLAYWQFDTSLAALLALCSNIEDFINLYNTQFNITKNSILPTENN